MARAVNTIVTRVDNSQAYREMGRLREEVNQVRESFSRLQSVIAGVGLGAFVTQTLTATARITELASATGLTGQSIAAFQMALRDAGGTMDQAGDAISSLIKKIGEARAGSTDAISAFGEIGITMQDLANLDNQEILQRTIQGLQSIRDPATRSAAAIRLMEEAVKRVDFGRVNIGQYANQSRALAETGESVRQVQINLSRSLDTVRDSLVQALKPLVDLLAQLTSNQQAVKTFIEGMLEIGKTVAIFFAVTKSAKLFADVLSLIGTRKSKIKDNIIESNGALKLFGDTLKDAREGLKEFKKFSGDDKTFANLKALGSGDIRGGLQGLTKQIGAMGAGLVRVLPFIGQLVVGFELVSTAIKMITGQSIGEWFQKLGDDLEKFVTQKFPRVAEAINAVDDAFRRLMGGQTREQQAAMQQQIDAMTESVRKQAEVNKAKKQQAEQDERNKTAVLDYVRQLQAASAEQIRAYRNSIEASNRAFAAETAMIGLGEEARLLIQRRTEATNRFIEANAQMEQQIAKARAARRGSAEAQSVGVLLETQKKLTTEYNRELGIIDEQVKRRVTMDRAERNRVFLAQRLVDFNNQYLGILDEAARTGTSLAQSQRLQFEQQADAIARQQVATEEATRRRKLSGDEQLAIYAETRRGIEELINAQKLLNLAQERQNVRVFGRQRRADMEGEIQRLKEMTGAIGLTELERGFRSIDAAAREAARSAIAMEEIRIGENLDPARIQEYYDEAFKNTDRLQAAFQENFEASRTFSAGWRSAMADFKDTSSNASLVARQFFEQMKQWGESFADSIVDYFRTGKLEVSELVNDILADIARLTIRQTITAPITNALASGLGSFLSGGFGRTPTPSPVGGFQSPVGSGLGLRMPTAGATVSGAFAEGGFAQAGKSYVVGERGRELFTPQVPGRVSPMDQQPSPIVFNQTVNIDARSDVAAVRQAVRDSSAIAQAEMARAMRTGRMR